MISSSVTAPKFICSFRYRMEPWHLLRWRRHINNNLHYTSHRVIMNGYNQANCDFTVLGLSLLNNNLLFYCPLFMLHFTANCLWKIESLGLYFCLFNRKDAVLKTLSCFRYLRSKTVCWDCFTVTNILWSIVKQDVERRRPLRVRLYR